MKALFWQALKHGLPGGGTFFEILKWMQARGYRGSSDEVLKLLYWYVDQDKITIDRGSGRTQYRIRFMLDPPEQFTPATRSFIWEEIQEARPEAAPARPRKFMAPDFDLLPHVDQGDRGICVGSSGMLIALSHHWEHCPEDMPTPEQAAGVRVGVPLPGAPCTMPVIMFPYGVPSAQGLYDDSREEEGVTAPSGSITRGVSKVLVKYGWNTEEERRTSLSSRCVPTFCPPPEGTEQEHREKLARTAAPHRFDGFATVRTWEGLLQAIFESRGRVHIKATIWTNWLSKGCKGLFPDPPAWPEADGSHAMRAVGYDEDRQEVYVIHTWRSWDKLGGFTKKYYDASVGEAYVPLSSRDAAIARALYSKVKITCNVPAYIRYLGDRFPNTQETSIRVPRGSHVVIYAIPEFPMQVMEEELTWEATVSTEEVSVRFEFTPISTNEYILRMIQEIFKKIYSFLKKG